MKLKKIIVCFLAVVQVFLCAGCSDDANSNVSKTESVAPPISEESVEIYRTCTGECYHREGCDYLRSKIATSTHEIKAKGLRPCSKCEPPCFE